MEISDVAYVWQPYDPREFQSSTLLPTSASSAPGELDSEPDFDTPSDQLLRPNTMTTSKSTAAGASKALPVPGIPCVSTVASDAVLCVVCVVASTCCAAQPL